MYIFPKKSFFGAVLLNQAFFLLSKVRLVLKTTELNITNNRYNLKRKRL